MKTIAQLEEEILALEEQIGPDVVAPDPPEHLDATAADKWREVVASPDFTVTAGDADALTLYVTAWSRWRESEIKVMELGTVIKSPSGYPCQSPYLSIANKALEQVLKVGKRLGLADPRR
jgi:P27 family predicted phage terminase small subunit